VDNVACLEKLKGTDVGFLLAGMDPESMAAETLCFKEFVGIFEKEGVVDRGSQVDVTDVARAVVYCEAAGGTRRFVVEG